MRIATFLNATKKERGEVVKLGCHKISEGTRCLAFLTIGLGKTLYSSSSATLTPDTFQSHRRTTQQLPHTPPNLPRKTYTKAIRRPSRISGFPTDAETPARP